MLNIITSLAPDRHHIEPETRPTPAKAQSEPHPNALTANRAPVSICGIFGPFSSFFLANDIPLLKPTITPKPAIAPRNSVSSNKKELYKNQNKKFVIFVKVYR
ncbi:hypothetical protein BLOT_016473 [Blomia tropicalis]|nr:hypothetical protein BLOT_016473 [Blomia tropicalis]